MPFNPMVNYTSEATRGRELAEKSPTIPHLQEEFGTTSVGLRRHDSTLTYQNTKAGDPLEERTGQETSNLSGVNAKLLIQQLMEANTPFGLDLNKPNLNLNISQFRVVFRRVEGSALFNVMSILLILIDMVCIVLTLDATDSSSVALQVARILTLIITICFLLELIIRLIAHAGRGWSWILFLEVFVIGFSAADAVLSTILPDQTTNLLFIVRPARGIRIFRGFRGLISLARYSETVNIMVTTLTRSVKPLLSVAFLAFSFIMLLAVMLTIQVASVMQDMHDETGRRIVAEKFGDVMLSATTIVEAAAASMDIGVIGLALLGDAQRGSWSVTIFLAMLITCVLMVTLGIAGLAIGIFLSQMIFVKGSHDMEVGQVQFRKNHELVVSLNEKFTEAGYEDGFIQWDDVLKVLVVGTSSQSTTTSVRCSCCAHRARKVEKLNHSGADDSDEKTEKALQYILGHSAQITEDDFDDSDQPSTETLPKAVDESEFVCAFEEQGITIADARHVFNELHVFGPVSLGDFILQLFRYADKGLRESLHGLWVNHEQKKVLSRLLFHGPFVDRLFKTLQKELASLNDLLLLVSEEADIAAKHLEEVDKLEKVLIDKRKKLSDLVNQVDSREDRELELIQERRDAMMLNDHLQELEDQFSELQNNTQDGNVLQATVDVLADELVDMLCKVINEEIQAAS
eukprot:TRINITY_DN27249_c0_g1_i1.p1 TRINITY_DN27249_c0_g1~~TRINITY_DN27249_c0_g1_i1.p1  ORF type:complete len:687 (-),score=115.09 TRINITY_DN27249_c0_g1_i1:224-2284(-)